MDTKLSSFGSAAIVTGLMLLSAIRAPGASDFLEIAKKTGVTIRQEAGVTVWEGELAGKTKLAGPLAGKTIGVIVASEFSDFQAYYLASYLSEFGGKAEFLLVDWVRWKFTRPNLSTKGVQGMWGLSVDPMPVMNARHVARPLREADPGGYHALVVLGGHSADVMVTEDAVIAFLQAAYNKGAVVGAIGAGSLPLIAAGLMNGKECTGDSLVGFMLKRIGTFKDAPVVKDGRLITARDTVDTPAFVAALCSAFDPGFVPGRKAILANKRILLIAGEDFEDIELAVPVLEYIYRGAKVTLATFPPPLRSRPPLLGLEVVQGNFGLSVPLQEVPLSDYQVRKLSEVRVEDFDLVQIPGAFCPWNMLAAGKPVEFLKQAYAAGKIIAAICHGPIPLAAADLVKGRKVTGWLACKDAVRIMGGTYNADWSAVIDGQIVTGRVPADLPEFLDAATEALLRPQ
jgi:protease I